ncbi:MAG: UDP-N-acetylmuramoyl-L-alanyl-D-glutamate--2,6-diaminopimelate ligase [Acidobacteriota bacterium]
MRLSEVMEKVPAMRAPLPSDPEITGVAHDSRTVEPGDLFVALVGQRFDGRAFAPAAVERGAVAVAGPNPAPAGLTVPWLPVTDPRAVLGPLSAAVYGHPDRELVLVGVTGTNGKSTTATVISAILDAADLPAGFIGTLGYRFGDRTFPGGHTTPEASDLFRTLRRMRDAGARAVAMEVSSHALEMGRVAGAAFDAAVFTNLTRDHLDYHPDMESYFQAKRRLFGMLKPGGRAVVNVEDEYGKRLAAEIPDALTFGEGGDVRARDVEMTATGTRGVLVTPRGDLPFSTALLGRYNLLNLLAAAAVAEALGVPHGAIAAALSAQRPVPGRLEPVDRGQPFPVFVDYAHTDAALDAALRSVREIAREGKVAVVFGCGGDRDRGKRPLMGRVVGELSELPILTSDNPRSEDPLAILAAIEEGVKASGNGRYRLVPDRREAIREAIASAGPGWAVLVAGKGHEREQIVGDRKLPFSDFEEIEKALEERLWHG